MFLGILGGTPQHWAQYGHAYRDAWTRTGNPADAADIAVAVHGFVASGDRQAKADRILDLHELLGHTRQILQMDGGGLPHTTFLEAIELLGTEVLPQIRKELE